MRANLMAAAALALLFWALGGEPHFRRVEQILFDWRMTWRDAMRPRAVDQDPRIVVVSIEPSTYREIPTHPVFWAPLYAKAAGAILESGALAVGLDILTTYIEGPPSSAIADFARVAVGFRGRLVLVAYLDPDQSLQTPPAPILAPLGVENLALANFSLDQDGVARAQHLTPIAHAALGRESWPYLAVALAERIGGPGGGEAPPTDGTILINNSGRPFPSYRLQDVLAMDSASLRERFAGRIALIGSRAKVDQDIVLTPGRSGFGVDYQADILNNLLSGHWLRPVPDLAVLLGLLACNTAMAQLAWRSASRSSALALAGGLGAWTAASVGLYWADRVLPMAPGLFSLAVTWSLVTWRRSRQEQQLMRILEGYVAPEIMREMLADPKSWLTSLTQRRVVTVLFSDINDFSTVSEREPAETVAHWLDEHYREMAHVIFDNQGTIIRFVGDQFMVLFGAPRPHSQPEVAAVKTALAMHHRLGQMAQSGRPGFYKIKIGIHRGPILLAVLGDELKHEYTAIGDDANVAARIQDLCKQTGDSTLVSQEICDECRQDPRLRFCDRGEWKVKGRVHTVRVFAVEETPMASRDDAASRPSG